ncbi:MAG: hypothetical protein K2X71_25185 [Methylobacterium sp.]|uniref:hypothetical protein n=1 Tax=Methylobacterium sp. TaxID=409 RepID=UPI002586A464|nr:hypothetical protein [Methylobacterium sp.]MBY0299291.1 hypothetical protein [Methylobacterium sp.]
MFSIGPFYRSAGQPAGVYTSLLPLEPEPFDAVAPAARSAAPAAPTFGRHALTMVLLVALTVAVQSAVGWWTLPGAPQLAPSAQGPIERSPS